MKLLGWILRGLEICAVVLMLPLTLLVSGGLMVTLFLVVRRSALPMMMGPQQAIRTGYGGSEWMGA